MPSGPHAGNRNRPAYSGQQRFRFPKQIIQLFAPRKPIEFKPPPRQRKLKPMTGLGTFVSMFEDPKDQRDTKMADGNEGKPETPFETPAQRRRRVRNEALRKVSEIVEKRREEWDPKSDDSAKTKNAYSTLFVANLPFTMVEKSLRDVFEVYGPVATVVMPSDREGVSRGYAFVEFERERDMKIAWREANGMRVGGRRILIDVERGRTVDGWLPNRLDGPNNACTRKRRSERREVRQRLES